MYLACKDEIKSKQPHWASNGKAYNGPPLANEATGLEVLEHIPMTTSQAIDTLKDICKLCFAKPQLFQLADELCWASCSKDQICTE